MKKKIGDTIVEIPFWYNLDKKIISDFFEDKIFKIFESEFMEWEEYSKKIEGIDDINFEKSLIRNKSRV